MILLQITPIDWNASIAWIAFFISLIGTVFGPIITALITNHHQLKLRELEIKQRNIDSYTEKRSKAIETFLANTGRCLVFNDRESVRACGESFHNVYPYVPQDLWRQLDFLYEALTAYEWGNARSLYSSIAHRLCEILKEPAPVNQSIK